MKQRELKFRVWDGERMHNVSGQGLHLIFWNDPTRIGWGLYDASEAKLTDNQYGIASVMQFTGLQDIQGKDIYESDKLLHPSDPNPMTVVWHERTAGFGLTRNGWMYTHYFHEAVDPKECTVIGNIYEPLPTNTTEG